MKEHEYEVTVVRIGYAVQAIRVAAANKDAAKQKALGEAPSLVFNEHDSDYRADSAVRVG